MDDGSALRGFTSAPHGVKRRAEDDLKDEQRLTRRLNLLHIGIILLLIYHLT